MSDLNNLIGTWKIDPAHTSIGFSAKHAMVTTVRGQFKDFEGTITVTDRHTGSVQATIKSTSIDSGQDKRDAHLRSGDFLDVEKYPVITFSTTGLKDIDGDEFVLMGDFTILDQTRPIELETEFSGIQTDHADNIRAGFEAKTQISRKDFGLTWNAALEAGGVLVSDKIKIMLDISAIKG